MAQRDSSQAESLKSEKDGLTVFDEENIPRSDVITGDRDCRNFLLYQLRKSMRLAQRVDIIVSFLMESGVWLLLDDLREALDRGVHVRILTGNYLGITQPGALYLLRRELRGRVDLRLYSEKERSFHPKAYIFHTGHSSEIYIGSSNISRSALTSGIEWNYRFDSLSDPDSVNRFMRVYDDLFTKHALVMDDEALRQYSESWRKPAAQRDIDELERASLEELPGAVGLVRPRGAQIEALHALEATRLDGADKALIYAATGTGKTLIAAFDSRKFDRVLFVAHRTEILRQAARSFRLVRKSEDTGYFDGESKETGKPVIFASVNTLGRSEYLNEKYFPPDAFDYIVIDEFHHAVGDMYRRILAYFRPKFLLGLTATPERLDGRNIYEICDYNVPYQISLAEAVNKGMLAPFRFYGICDTTVDYSSVRPVRGQYREEDLNRLYENNRERCDLIHRHFLKHRSERALGFCCSRMHAEMMAGDFCARGIPSAAVYSDSFGEYALGREEAVRKLKGGEIQVIFSVDIFNEGVDIPSVDLVMFLRPTESPTVFLQQLGRGLRLDPGKEFLTVLDFIGNYEKAGLAPFLLSGRPYSSSAAAGAALRDFVFPDGCIVDFDLGLVDLFRRMAQRTMKIRGRIEAEYARVKELVGHVPSRMELFTWMDDEVYELCARNAKDNPFRDYLSFLHRQRDLTLAEERLHAGIGREFLHLLETTNMTKSYKMPVLLAIYNGGEVRMAVTGEDIYRSYKRFYGTGLNGKDLERDKSTSGYRTWTRERYIAEARKNPVHFLLRSGGGFFVEKPGYILALRDDLEQVRKDGAFVRHMGDIIEYRTTTYYRSRYTDRAPG